jgi:uncharacterized Rmd1/YagE family protein
MEMKNLLPTSRYEGQNMTYGSLPDQDEYMNTYSPSHPHEGADFKKSFSVDDPTDIYATDQEESDLNMYYSADEFEGRHENSRGIRTGRQRKKIAARTKGGEFQAKRRKRRVYVCCVSTEIDIQKLYEHIMSTLIVGVHKAAWKAVLYGEALHIAKTGPEAYFDNFQRRDPSKSYAPTPSSVPEGGKVDDEVKTSENDFDRRLSAEPPDTDMKMSDLASREVYIFEFGSVVFWGFSRGEESRLLDVVRDFSTKMVEKSEFEAGEDDIAFVVSADTFRVVMSNDVISLPFGTTPKQRLAVSFAIAQSTVLALYENRIDSKVADYKYIPELLSKDGKIKLSMREIGRMIGDIFVIRHDLNLHSYILDVPDFFWEENKDDDDFAVYKMIMRYLEMDSRVEVLNKRLDMLRDLLDMLQQQMENAHASKLEWIVIWLIVVEVIIEVISLTGAILGWWTI